METIACKGNTQTPMAKITLETKPGISEHCLAEPDHSSIYTYMTCKHPSLNFELSTHAANVGYRRSTAQQRASATVAATHRNRNNASANRDIPASTFPAPLLLPDDALSIDPRCPPQSLRSWLRLKDRNEVTTEKNKIYVAGPPDTDPSVQFMQSWSHPQTDDRLVITTPRTEDIINYLTAFYHGLPVKLLPPPKLCFATWDTAIPKRSKSKSSKSMIPPYIGLNTPTECVRIRARPSPDGVFTAQLNLDDLLDAAISMLPNDAYAFLLVVEHDLFEHDDDLFICGRAYGGSRVAVISTARYHPILDDTERVEREHAWPASHCELHIQACCATVTQSSSTRPKKRTKLQNDDADLSKSHLPQPPPDRPTLPMLDALAAHKGLDLSSSPIVLSGLWLGRVCRTASHELGHCFGIEHCTYYACIMQGSCSLAEDARQPPYLCPIDLAKTLDASGTTAETRYQALLKFCEQHADVHLFAAFAAWISARLARDYPQLASSSANSNHHPIALRP